jgi:hypothetical protein
LLACRKNNEEYKNYNGILRNVKSYLSDSMLKNDFQNLDFSKSAISNLDSVNLHLLRVPFKHKNIKDEFILLQINKDGAIVKGRLVNISEAIDNNINTSHSFNGNITISWLNRSVIVNSEISNGYIKSFHPAISSQRSLVVPNEGHVLGEVVVVSYITNDNSISYSFWMNLMSLFMSGSGGGAAGLYDNYYNSLSANNSPGGGGNYGGEYGGGGTGSYGGGYNGGGGQGGKGDEVLPFEPTEDLGIYIDFEHGENNDAIKVEDYLKCFATIPDAGATCSIEILSDIPVDNDPNKFFNWNTGSPGHTFLQIRKSNGSQIVSQNIGFYPEQGWKTMLTPAPVTGKFVDNGEHEFNASLKRNLTPDQLKGIIIEIESLAKNIKYDIDEYNCTDFALEVFNSVPFSTPLEIPKYNIPGGMAPNGTSTPQGLYQKLKNMRQAGQEYNNITIPGVKGFVSDSNGPCN